MKKLTSPQAATLRYLLREEWEAIPFHALDVFPSRTNADNANRRMLSRLYEAGCLTKDAQGRYAIDRAASDAALREVSERDDGL